MRYQVIDVRTQQVMGTYATSRGAYRRADRLDREYGAVRYIVRFVESARSITGSACSQRPQRSVSRPAPRIDSAPSRCTIYAMGVVLAAS